MSLLTGVLIPIVAGTLLIGARFAKSEYPKWVLNALSVAGVLAVLAGMISLLGGHEFDASRSVNLIRLRAFLGGTVVGSLLTLFVAGQLKFRKAPKHTRD